MKYVRLLTITTRRSIYAGILTALSLSAVAQERQLEEVLVTAQKRAESLQDVPISVTAISAQDLQVMGIQDTSELIRASASLTYTEAGNKQESSFRIRGVGTAVYSVSVEPSVAVVIDDVSQVQFGQAFTNLVDIERVEVLRGPQSTLFGKSASAGLINVVTKRSSDTLEGFVEGSYTDDEELRFKGSLSGPLGDNLGYRLTGFYTDFDGYAKNLHFNKKDINGVESKGVRGRLDWTPTDELDLSLIAFYTDEDDDCCSPTHRSVAPGAAYVGIIPFETMNPLTNPSDTNKNPETDVPNDADTKDKGFSVHADWQLGEHTLTSITAYNEWDYDNQEDWDWSGYDLYGFISGGQLGPGGVINYSEVETELVSQELRLLSPSGGDWEYLVGLYYADADTDKDNERTFPLEYSVSSISTGTETMAAFGQITWKMTESTHLTMGGRYNYEEISVKNYSEKDAPGLISADYSATDDEDKVLGKLSVQHFLNEESMLFASVATGYKGQAYDITDNMENAGIPIDSETSVSYEVGAKTTLLDRRLQFNANVFYTEYDDYQAQSSELVDGGFQTTLNNVGKLETKGVEVDAVALIGENLTLTTSAAWIDATIEKYPNAPCYYGQTEAEGCVEIIPGSDDFVQDLSGEDLNNSPEWKFTVGAQYDVLLPSLPFDGFITAGYVWQDDVIFSLRNNPYTKHDSYGVANLSLGINERQSNRYSVTLFVNNVFDEEYAGAMGDLSGIYGARTIMHYIPRSAERYAGVRVRLGF